ncbi:hypothetical protein HDU85_003676 [Gaertneriomyces sp. JEL0708]|nr:hypothetical protein HDU85_003676 [Gaertneriomyces sp. JEL0708]
MPPSPGTGHIQVSLSSTSARQHLTHLSSTYPLRLLAPTPTSSHHTTVYILSYGGGYVSGDAITATIHVHQGCALSLLTRGWGRVFAHSKTDTDPSSASIGVRQSISTQVAAQGLLVYLPHPLQMTSRARFVQRQQFVLDPAASLLVLDCFTCGRASRGEMWDFELYESRNEICVQSEDGTRRTVVRDDWVICDENAHGSGKPEEGMQLEGPLSRSYKPRLYPYHIFATLFIIGPRLNGLISHVTSSYNRFIITSKGTGNSINIQKGRDLIWSVSDIPNDIKPPLGKKEDKLVGIVVKAAAVRSEVMNEFLKSLLLDGLKGVIGDSVWDGL